MKTYSRSVLASTMLFVLAACGGADQEEGRKVDASGKEATEMDAIPAAVLDLVKTTRPDMTIAEAEYETRDGNEYYDVGGTLPDGSELELDMTLVDGVWTVVEVQRDIGMDGLPASVADALGAKFPEWVPERIIESDQGDGVVIYEFFGKDDSGADTKIEVKWADGAAEVLVDEWVH